MPELWLPTEDRHARWEPVGDQVRVIGWRPGPAGLSSIELADGLWVAIDHAHPTTLAEVAVHLVDGQVAADHLPLLSYLLGDEATDRLRRVAGSRAATRPVPLPAGGDAYHEDLDRPRRRPAFAELAIAADLGDDAHGSDDARAVARLEAADRAMVLGLSALASAHARRALDLLEATPPVLGDDLAHQVAAIARRIEAGGDTLLQARLRRAADQLISRPAAEPAYLAAAAMMTMPMAAAEEVPPRAATLPIEVDGAHRAWAGLTATGNVVVTATSSAEGTWARVFRRSDRLLLGLSPLREARSGGQLQSTVVIPRTDPEDLVVDLVRDPATPRRSPAHDDTRKAVLAGRTAARLTRRRDPSADDAWALTATRWRDLGDAQRANLAERHGQRDDRARRGSPRFNALPRLLADDLR